MRHLPHGSHHHNAKAVSSFLILILATSVLFIFYANQDTILQEGKFQLFMTLAAVVSGLLVGLLYLVSNSKDKVQKAHSVKAKGGKAKKSRK